MVKSGKTFTPTKCTVPSCTKLLSSKYNLKRHIEFYHCRCKPYECSICFKRFSSKKNKIEHISIEHSYSQCVDENMIPRGIREEIKIPLLSSMIKFSIDLDLRPFAKMRKTYRYPFNHQEIPLPQIYLSDSENTKLPSLP